MTSRKASRVLRRVVGRLLPRRRRRIPGRARLHFAQLRTLDPAARLAALHAPGSPWVVAAAEYGLAEAQVVLGQRCLDGDGMPHDPALAFTWFAAAAGAGYPPALNMLGRCHEKGWGTPADPGRAAPLYRRAAEAGLDWAQFNLGCLRLYGLGVEQDRADALAWFHRAAAQDHAKSANMIGRCWEAGWAVPPNLAEAARWYGRAARGGDYRGQFNLGSLLAQAGRKADALPWLSRALASGDPDFAAEARAALLASDDPDYRLLGAAP